MHPHLKVRGRGGRSRGGYRGVSSGRSTSKGTGRGIPFNAHHAVSDYESSTSRGTLNASELDTFRQLLSQLNTNAAIPTANSAHAGISCHFISDKFPTSWIIDSGASTHMTRNSNFLESYHGETGKIRVANGATVPVHGQGTCHCLPSLPLSNVLHVPSLSANLLSVPRITENLNCSVTFFPSYCVFQDLATGRVLGSGKLVDGLYVMESNSVCHLNSYQVSSKSNPVLESLYQWHRRLGHPSFGVLAHLFPKLASKCNKEEFFCEPCELAKHKRSSYPSNNKRSSNLFSTIHTDVWGPFRHPTHDGYRWFVVFVDCHSRLTWVYLLKHKSEVFECFKSFHHMIQTQFNASVKILRSDNGTEYHGQFTSYLDTYGIIHQTTCVKTSQQNGVAERKIGHLQQVARSC